MLKEVKEILSKKVYVLDLKNKKVLTGRIYGAFVTDNGYIKYSFQEESTNIFKDPDDGITYDNLREAQEALAIYAPINAEMLELQDKTNKLLDTMRERIIGKPAFPPLNDKK